MFSIKRIRKNQQQLLTNNSDILSELSETDMETIAGGTTTRWPIPTKNGYTWMVCIDDNCVIARK
jgi:hypothetical protein